MVRIPTTNTSTFYDVIPDSDRQISVTDDDSSHQHPGFFDNEDFHPIILRLSAVVASFGTSGLA